MELAFNNNQLWYPVFGGHRGNRNGPIASYGGFNSYLCQWNLIWTGEDRGACSYLIITYWMYYIQQSVHITVDI